MQELLTLILKSLWYILPAYLANISPVFAYNIFKNKFSTPIDFNKKLLNRPLFGKNKTYRGFISGILVGILVSSLQSYLYAFKSIKDISLFDYTSINPVIFGFLMGFGALFGDLAKSFVKRRLNFKPGASWIPFDQTDFLVGGMFFASFVYRPGADVIITILLVMPIVKVIIDQIGFYLKISRSQF